MTPQSSIPPFRELPPETVATRLDHLVDEIGREPRARRRTRAAVLGVVAVALAVAAAGAVVALTRGSEPARSAYLVQTIGGTNDSGASSCTPAAHVLFGCDPVATAPTAEEARPLPSESEPVDETAISGGTAEHRALLDEIVRAIGPTSIASIQVDESAGTVTLDMRPHSSSLHTLWQSWLIATAFRDRASPEVEVDLVNGDSNGESMSHSPALPRASAADADDARAVFEQAAHEAGVEFDDLSVTRPAGVAVAATLRSDDPASFLLHQMADLVAATSPHWNDYDGVYLRLEDGSGNVVWETATATRINTGAVGSRADVTGCGPISNHGPTPPPCPAD